MCLKTSCKGLQLTIDFLVYEHWRPDTGLCFYVGKGKMKRAHSFRRGNYYDRIIAKLARSGMKPEVRIVQSGMTEDAAFALEIKLIAFWRAAGIGIANRTAGGDGTSGKRHSERTRAKIRQKALGRKSSPETKALMSKIRSAWKWSDETKAKMRKSALVVQGDSRKRYCQTQAGNRQMLAMSRKAASSPEVRVKRSENATNLWKDPTYRANVMAARAASRCVSKAGIKGFS
jgi:hypothetical protein